MILPDVNVLVYAFRPDADDHPRYWSWLDSVVNGPARFACSDHVLSGFLRVLTNPAIPWKHPTPAPELWRFANTLRDHPNCVRVYPGPAHWGIFQRLCAASHARGNKIPDAYFAALAIESGCEWITTDRGFNSFKGLRWRHPLER